MLIHITVHGTFDDFCWMNSGIINLGPDSIYSRWNHIEVREGYNFDTITRLNYMHMLDIL